MTIATNPIIAAPVAPVPHAAVPVRRLRAVLARFHVGVTLVAVAIAGLSVFMAGVTALRGYADRNLALSSQVAAYSVEPALVFDDPVAARASLAPLSQVAGVRRVQIVTPDGKIFAEWQTNSADPAPQVTRLLFPLPVSAQIRSGDTVVGQVRTWGDASAILDYVWLGLMAGLLCLVLTGVGVWLIARRLEAELGQRLEAVASVAREVRLHRQLSARVAPQPIMEFDRLGKDMNALLDELQGWHRTLADQHAALAAAAHRDALTGLANRGAFDQHLTQSVAAARDAGTSLALLYLDLDGFKQVNDAFGHGAGDEVLRQIGAHLAAGLGPDDFAARIGGDEFAVVMANISERAATQQMAARMADVAAAIPNSVAGAMAGLAGSVGIAYYPDDGTTAVKLLYAADFAMYRAKHGLNSGSRA